MLIACSEVTEGKPVGLPSCQCPDTHIRIVNRTPGSCFCWACPDCGEGQGLSVPCNSTMQAGHTDIECLACVYGRSFSVHRGTTQCRNCSQCGEHVTVLEACNLEKDTVCGDCKAGFYRDPHTGVCLPCSACCGRDDGDAVVEKCKLDRQPPKMQCAFDVSKAKCPSTPNTNVPGTTKTPTEGSADTSTVPHTTEQLMLQKSTYVTTILPITDEGELKIMHQTKAGELAGALIGAIAAALILVILLIECKKKYCENGNNVPESSPLANDAQRREITSRYNFTKFCQAKYN